MVVDVCCGDGKGVYAKCEVVNWYVCAPVGCSIGEVGGFIVNGEFDFVYLCVVAACAGCCELVVHDDFIVLWGVDSEGGW